MFSLDFPLRLQISRGGICFYGMAILCVFIKIVHDDGS
jgi:hypothetical protein